jgi:predicted nucleic acid-binding protein
MSADRATYVDSSALVKLAIREPESDPLRRYLSRRRPLISSALARTEVVRALVPLGSEAVQRGREVLARVDLMRLSNRILDSAGTLTPPDLRSLDAIHLASAGELGSDLKGFVTYDERLARAATTRGMRVIRPG